MIVVVGTHAETYLVKNRSLVRAVGSYELSVSFLRRGRQGESLSLVFAVYVVTTWCPIAEASENNTGTFSGRMFSTGH